MDGKPHGGVVEIGRVLGTKKEWKLEEVEFLLEQQTEVRETLLARVSECSRRMSRTLGPRRKKGKVHDDASCFIHVLVSYNIRYTHYLIT
jgi:predicted metalloprotease